MSRRTANGVLAGLAIILTTLGLGAAHDHRQQQVDCPLATARFDSTNGGALVVQMCATLPPIGGVIIRYDLALRIWIFRPGAFGGFFFSAAETNIHPAP
jgi:hypothetical protein